MEYLFDLVTNKSFIAPVAAWAIAQVLKIIIDTFRSGFCKERIVGGGMPSSQSALVTAFICLTALHYGLDSFEFAAAFFLGAYVIHYARRVCYEAQRYGKALNNLNEEREEEGKQPLDIVRFKEKLGHTDLELLVGALVGLICGIVVYNLPF